jgi:hypothetical protein
MAIDARSSSVSVVIRIVIGVLESVPGKDKVERFIMNIRKEKAWQSSRP